MLYFFLWRSILSLQTVQTLIKCHIMQHFILVFVVCKIPIKRFPVYKGLNVYFSGKCRHLCSSVLRDSTVLPKQSLHCAWTTKQVRHLVLKIHIFKGQARAVSQRCYAGHRDCFMWILDSPIYEQQSEISNNVVCATSKVSDQPVHVRSLIRAFASCLNVLWVLSYWLNFIWSF